MSLPADYTFIGPGYEQSENNLMFIRTLNFRLDAESPQVIELCVTTPERTARTCVPAEAVKQALPRNFGQYPIWIRPVGTDTFSQADREFWKDVPITDNLDSVPWLS